MIFLTITELKWQFSDDYYTVAFFIKVDCTLVETWVLFSNKTFTYPTNPWNSFDCCSLFTKLLFQSESPQVP